MKVHVSVVIEWIPKDESEFRESLEFIRVFDWPAIPPVGSTIWISSEHVRHFKQEAACLKVQSIHFWESREEVPNIIEVDCEFDDDYAGPASQMDSDIEWMRSQKFLPELEFFNLEPQSHPPELANR